MCAAKFTDGEWYRARVEKLAGTQVVSRIVSIFFPMSIWSCCFNRSTCSTWITVIEKCQLRLNVLRFRLCTRDRHRLLMNTHWLALLFRKMYLEFWCYYLVFLFSHRLVCILSGRWYSRSCHGIQRGHCWSAVALERRVQGTQWRLRKGIMHYLVILRII